MAEHLTKAFWLSILAAVPSAYLMEPGPGRWIAIAWLCLIGGLFILANWAILARSFMQKRASSLVPLLGGLLVAAGVGAIPAPVRWWAPLALVLDPWLSLMLVVGLRHLFRFRSNDRGDNAGAPPRPFS